MDLFEFSDYQKRKDVYKKKPVMLNFLDSLLVQSLITKEIKTSRGGLKNRLYYIKNQITKSINEK